MSYTVEDIYMAFRRAQSLHLGRGYRMPKDFEKHLSKMNKTNRDYLKLATDYFNTRWSNIEPQTFFECGFELFKTFSYNKFFDERVLNLYKMKDKNRKRDMRIAKDSMKDSLSFVKDFISDNGINSIKEYSRKRDGNSLIAIDHYLHNHIDKYFLVMLISKGYVILNDDDRVRIPYIVEQYRECLSQLRSIGKEGI